MIGILALQGGFAPHAQVCESLGQAVRLVRVPADLQDLRALILPGGESTTMRLLLDRQGLQPELSFLIRQGLPVFGTCAGLILLAGKIAGESPILGSLDITVARNAYGSQVDSFVGPLTSEIPGLARGLFIRAPRIQHIGAGVEVLARHNDEPVLVRQGNIIGACFHPELSGGPALHRYFISLAGVP